MMNALMSISGEFLCTLGMYDVTMYYIRWAVLEITHSSELESRLK